MAEMPSKRKRLTKKELVALKASGRLPDGSKRVSTGSIRKDPKWQPRPQLSEKPESSEEWGAATYAILRAYNPELTVYEVAKRAGMLSSMDDVRRVLLYHKKKCISMRKRIDNLVRQLEGRAPMKLIL